MASYFELPPSQNAEAAAASSIRAVPEAERKQLGKMSLMSPAVSQLLEDLGNDDSDSSEDNKSLSEDGAAEVGPKKLKSESSGPPRQDENTQSKEEPERRKPSALSPSRTAAPKPNQGKASSGHVKSLSTRNSDAGSSSKKQKPAHIARFHSLRSMLFQANIQDKMKTVTKEDCQKKEDAADRWRNQHEQRQMHRPKTPEKEHVEKDGLGSRIKGKIRRMTSKEVPTLQNIGEDSGAVGTFDDRASTASSDLEDDIRHPEWKDEDGDSESIDHSDVEELVRWVSRRDPPSDGEKRKNKVVHTELVEDSGHESLGHSDVDDLVRWVSRRSDVPDSNTKPMSDNHHTGYSDASTESDSEVARQSSDEEDADDLVRWISHRDGPKAGPVRRKLERAELDSEVEQHYDSDVPELGRWIKRHDATSGESAASSPVRGESAGFSNNCDVEEEEEEEEERGRPRSRDSHPSTKLTKNHLTHEDVDELVRWVSRKDSKAQEQSTLENDDRTLEWKRQEDEKKKKEQLGMSMDDGSLSHGDVQELVEHAKGVEVKDTLGVTGLNAAINTASTTITTEEGRGDGASDVPNIQATEQAKKKDLGMSLDEGSLSHSDVQDLIAHVRKDSSSPQNDTFNKTGAGERDVVESGHARGSLDEQDVNELVRWVSTRQ